MWLLNAYSFWIRFTTGQFIPSCCFSFCVRIFRDRSTFTLFWGPLPYRFQVLEHNRTGHFLPFLDKDYRCFLILVLFVFSCPLPIFGRLQFCFLSGLFSCFSLIFHFWFSFELLPKIFFLLEGGLSGAIYTGLFQHFSTGFFVLFFVCFGLS